MSGPLSAVAGAYVLAAGFLGAALVLAAVTTGRRPPWRRLPALLNWATLTILVAAVVSAHA